jgi:hypothetical protein
MATAVTRAGVWEGSSGRRWVPVRMLPWRKMVSGGFCAAATEATSRIALNVRAFTDGV